nr:Membrane-associated kinase regulator 6 [Ipomoea batatas]
MSTSYLSHLPPPSSRYRLNATALSKSSLPPVRTSIVTASLHNARWRLSCSRREDTSLESVNYESVDDDIPQVVNSEFDQPNNAKSDLVFHLKKAFHAVLHIEPWTVPWTVRTIAQVMLLWIASFWLVGSWIIPFLAHSAGFRKESLTYQGLALYCLLTDVAGGIAGMAILHHCLAKFFPLPSNWFKFSLGGKWHFDVGLCCIMFPLINRLSQFAEDVATCIPWSATGYYICTVKELAGTHAAAWPLECLSDIRGDHLVSSLFPVLAFASSELPLCPPLSTTAVGTFVWNQSRALASPMETSQSLSIDSFSYSWLVNLKPSFESLESSFRASLSDEEASFIEMDPKLSPSKRFFSVPQDFNFDLPISDSPFAIVHADELISNGFLVPLFFKPRRSMEACDASSDSMPTTPSTSVAQNEMVQSSSPPLRSCRRLSRQFFQKYLDFLRPICQKLQRCRLRPRHRTVNSRMKNWADFSSATSPRTSSVDNWRRSFDSESSIHEAVLHCKRTIGI